VRKTSHPRCHPIPFPFPILILILILNLFRIHCPTRRRSRCRRSFRYLNPIPSPTSLPSLSLIRPPSQTPSQTRQRSLIPQRPLLSLCRSGCPKLPRTPQFLRNRCHPSIRPSLPFHRCRPSLPFHRNRPSLPFHRNRHCRRTRHQWTPDPRPAAR